MRREVIPQLDVRRSERTSEWDTLSVSRRGDVTILAPAGDIDGWVMDRLTAIVFSAAAWDADVVLDLSAVGTLSARAIELIGGVAAEVQRSEGRWVVVAIDDGDDPVRFNAVATLASKVTTCTDVDEAVALLREPALAGAGLSREPV
jgi:anti-anti-sigma regulatory factor